MDIDIFELSKFITTKFSDKIYFLLGAGISTNSGIPDYRNNKFIQDGIEYSPEEAFSRKTFYENPDLLRFFKKDMIACNYKPTIAHAFLAILEKKGKLGTVFTQNIDDLEYSFIKNRTKIVQMHGSLSTIRCDTKKCTGTTSAESYASGNIECPVCEKKTLRPDIILYGESLNSNMLARMKNFLEIEQKYGNNILIVSGTTLVVKPNLSIALDFNNKGSIYNINNQPVRNKNLTNHVDLLGDCDVVYLKLICQCGWFKDLLEYFESLCDKSKSAIQTFKYEPPKFSLHAILIDNTLHVSNNLWFRQVMEYKNVENIFQSDIFDTVLYHFGDKHGIVVSGNQKTSNSLIQMDEESIIKHYQKDLEKIPFFQNIFSIFEKQSESDEEFV